MTRLVGAVLARNEAGSDRYLKRVLDRLNEVCDAIVLLDDDSTDATASIARQAGAIVHSRSGSKHAWGAEAPARRALWKLAVRESVGGWVLVCDADMLIQGDVRSLCESWDAAGWAFLLADLWDSETTFRVDGAWGAGPTTPRPWLFNMAAAPAVAEWSQRGIHCGHAPSNWPGPIFAAPPDIFWKHLGWTKRAHREAKAAQYAACRDQLTPFEAAHAASILDTRVE